MPGRKHLRGASAKEQRQYEHILESAKEEGRYGRRAKEVAARTVMKQHGEEGHPPHRASAAGDTRTETANRSPAGRRTTKAASTPRGRAVATTSQARRAAPARKAARRPSTTRVAATHSRSTK